MVGGWPTDPHMQKISPIGLVSPSVAVETGCYGASGSVLERPQIISIIQKRCADIWPQMQSF